jgi:DNA repair photolyase
MEYQPIECKTLLHRHDSGYLPYHWDANIYRGCAHSCLYCFARYSHEYLGYRDPFDFEQKILVKVNAPQVLDRELASPKWRGELVNLSGVSDPYQPAEKKFGLTRQVLEVMLKHRNPTMLGTKSDLIRRDLDLLSRLSERTFCSVAVTITTLDEGLRRQLEPFSSPARRRVALLKKLKEAGVKTGLLATPILPYLTDDPHSLEELVRTAAECEVDFTVAGVLSLRSSARQRFMPFLRRQFPENLTAEWNSTSETEKAPQGLISAPESKLTKLARAEERQGSLRVEQETIKQPSRLVRRPGVGDQPERTRDRPTPGLHAR